MPGDGVPHIFSYKTVSGRWGEGTLKFREFVRGREKNLHQFYTK